MADHCGYCDVRRPKGGTNMLVIGNDWFEFCEPCGNNPEHAFKNSETGEELTPKQLFDKIGDKLDDQD